jgi:hypothetical protein
MWKSELHEEKKTALLMDFKTFLPSFQGEGQRIA